MDNKQFLLDQLDSVDKKYNYPFDWGGFVEGVASYAYSWRWPLVILAITIYAISKL